jgi:hypothetical protein
MPLRKLETIPGTTAFAVHGMLTSHDVAVVRQALASPHPPRELVVDLRAAPAPMAPALLELARALGEAGGRQRLLGLTAASERLLKLLGIELGSVAAAASGRAEEVET